MTATVKITVPYYPADREVEALPTPVPGLCIHAELNKPGRWVITHMRSGGAVAKCPDPELALDVAIKLGALGDWTRPAREVIHDPVIVRGRERILRQRRISHHQDGPTIPEGELRDTAVAS